MTFFISEPTLEKLKPKLRTDLSITEQYIYHDHNIIRSGRLYDISEKKDLTHVSKHFVAGEFASTNHHYLRLHENLVYELEKIRYFFKKAVTIKVGYVPNSEYDEARDFSGIKKNHIGGLAARILIDGIKPLKLAEFAIIIGAYDTSYSLGENDIILAVKQTKATVTTHLGENDKKRSQSRFRRGLAEKHLMKFYDFFQGKKTVSIEAVLGEHYKALHRTLLAPNRRGRTGYVVDNNLKHTLDAKFTKEQVKLILHLHQNHRLQPKFIILIFLYSDFVNLYLHFHRLIQEYKSDIEIYKRINAINKIIAALCPEKPYFRSYDTPEYRSWISSCNEKDIKLPFTRHSQLDKLIHSYITALVERTIENKKQIPAASSKPILGLLSNKKLKRNNTPDNPKYNITGRYEAYSKDSRFLGFTLVINQAGNHLEGVLSIVDAPQIKTKGKDIFHIHGNINPEGVFISFFKAAKRAGDEISLTVIKNDNLYVNITLGTQKSKYTFEKYHESPIILSPMIYSFSEMVKRHEKAPLLNSQIAHLEKNFSVKPGIKKLTSLLTDYNTPEYSPTKSQQSIQSKTAEKINALFYSVMHDKQNGINDNDIALSAFYLRFFLSSNFWSPTSRGNLLSVYDYVHLMVQQESVQPYKLGGYVKDISLYLDLPDYEAKKTIYKYKAKIKLTGLSVFSVLGGGGYLSGELEITKLSDEGLWPKGDTATYGVVNYLAGTGKGVKTSMEGECEFATAVEWFQEDFPGWVESATMSISAKFANTKSNIGGFFVIIRNSKGSIKLDFEENVFFKRKNPTKPGSAKPGGGYFTIINFMKISKQTAAQEFKVHITRSFFSNYVEKQYAQNKNTFFSFDSDVLSPEALQALRIFCALELDALLSMFPPVDIVIVGFTDRVGTEDYNNDLSTRRAKSVHIAIQNILYHQTPYNTIRADTISAGENVARFFGGDKDERENPRFRGAKIFFGGRLALTLGGTYF